MPPVSDGSKAPLPTPAPNKPCPPPRPECAPTMNCNMLGCQPQLPMGCEASPPWCEPTMLIPVAQNPCMPQPGCMPMQPPMGCMGAGCMPQMPLGCGPPPPGCGQQMPMMPQQMAPPPPMMMMAPPSCNPRPGCFPIPPPAGCMAAACTPQMPVGCPQMPPGCPQYPMAKAPACQSCKRACTKACQKKKCCKRAFRKQQS